MIRSFKTSKLTFLYVLITNFLWLSCNDKMPGHQKCLDLYVRTQNSIRKINHSFLSYRAVMSVIVYQTKERDWGKADSVLKDSIQNCEVKLTEEINSFIGGLEPLEEVDIQLPIKARALYYLKGVRQLITKVTPRLKIVCTSGSKDLDKGGWNDLISNNENIIAIGKDAVHLSEDFREKYKLTDDELEKNGLLFE